MCKSTDIARLIEIRDGILSVADRDHVGVDFAQAMLELLGLVDTLISNQKSVKTTQLFPILGKQPERTTKKMISGMKHYRLCATCEGCNETIFKDLRVTQLISLARRDAPWDDFKVKCQKDPSHKVTMESRYDTRSETLLPSYYRGKALAPVAD
ncbi:MAG: hypothetical protein JKY57_02255 [Kordiimonadaceae bacterium]|nr:hypothetical protein [Kordiimonadaceae bacterium]